MKHFYACPHIIVDHAAVKRDRFLYWDTWQHIYKEDRLVLLDTRYPSNKNLPAEKLDIVQDRFHQWTLYPGRLKAHEASMLEADTLLASRAARKLEEQQQQAIMQASLKRTRELEALIEGHKSLQPSKEGKRLNKSGTSKKAKASKTPRVKSDTKNVPNISKVLSPTAANVHTNAAMQQQIDQLLAALAEEKKKTSLALRGTNNSSASAVRYQEEKEISPPSKRIADLEKATKEEDLKLALVAKKRQVAEEEQDLQQLKAAKKKLKMESMSYASQLLREGELDRVKLKVQADQIQADHVHKEQKRAEEDRRREADFEDSKRRQSMQFASDEHALMLEKERARIKITDSTAQHNNMMQLVALSQRHHDLSLVMKHATPQLDSSAVSTHLDGPKTASKSSSSSSKNESACQSKDQASFLEDLKRQLKEEKDLRKDIRRGASDIAKYAVEDSAEDGDSSDEEEDGSDEDEE